MKNQIERTIQQEAEEKLFSYRNDELVKVIAGGKIQKEQVLINWKFIKRDENSISVEERQEERRVYYDENGALQISNAIDEEKEKNAQSDYPLFENENENERKSFFYDRKKAVQYAEIWWNTPNPKYPQFKDNCTNYISQCLLAGGFPMNKTEKKTSGWWYQNKNWSYSWTVAHSLKQYLAASKYTKTVDTPEQLTYGDIICYDFEGDGRFNHNTIVTGKATNGMPLVNANTTNSRQRYWAYKDSSAYTPNIRYRFFRIIGGAS